MTDEKPISERWLAAVNRDPIVLSDDLEARVMARVRRRAASPARRLWRWLQGPREVAVRVRLRPLIVVAAAAAVAIMFVVRPRTPDAADHAPVYVRFVFFAPGAGRVTVVGTFNQWDATGTPLAPTQERGLWTVTLPLPPGQHQYAFLVDGTRWVTDPAAPTVDDGFGHRNSVVAVTAQGEAGRAL